MVVLLALAGLTLTASSAEADSGDGTAVGWGYNGGGEITIPASLAGKDVIAISSMDGHSLALTSDGQVTGWGFNGSGQTDVPATLTGVVDVGAGCGHSIALTSDGHVTAWGDNSSGQTDVPASLGDQTVVAISAGCGFNLALTSDGQVTAWGQDDSGQSTVPASLADKTVTAIDAGFSHALAATSDGLITAWGDGGSGKTTVPGGLEGQTVTDVAAGMFHSVALTSDGQVTAWGDNSRNQTTFPWWTGERVISIEASVWHSLALTAEGNVLAWGHNGQCQLCVPALPPGEGYTAISVGHLHSVGVRAPLPIDFTTGPTATISGTPQVGQTLTADAGAAAVDPAPTSYAYRWFADDAEIAGATGPTYVLTSAEQGAAITVEVSAVKHGYNDATDTSDPTALVVPGTISATGTPAISGITTVGQTLTADSSSVTMDPEATLVHQWLRDGVPIPDADGASYDLTNADAGSSIAFRVTGTKVGYTDAPTTSATLGPVSGGVITLPTPTITGDPVVDGTLTAALPEGELDPADAEVTWRWHRGATPVGTGSTYTPDAADVGSVLTVRATATKDYFGRVSQSAETAQIALAGFSAGPVASITGTVKVGHVLVAGTGSVAPAPDDLSYQWYADEVAIDGATEPTFALTSAQKGLPVTVEVTATRAGYHDGTDLSAPTAPVATHLAPDLELGAADAALRRGESTVLTWTSAEADTVTASGAWSGAKAASSSDSVSPTDLGGVTYILEATNDNGTTTSQVTIEVTRQAKALAVTAPRGLHLTGNGVTVTTGGLDPGERYVIRIAGVPVVTGNVGSTGTLTRRVTVPSRASDGTSAVTVTGSESDRVGRTSIRVVKNKTLGLRLAKQTVRKRDRQQVTITGLAAGERVTVSFRGSRVSPSNARADASGRYYLTFRVGMRRGTHAVTVRGQFVGRIATTSFWVVARR